MEQWGTKIRGWARRERGILIIVAVQLALAAALTLWRPCLWPTDDDVTYVYQAFLMRMGAFPPDPTRPMLYPFLLSLVMRFAGLSWLALGLAQAIMLATTTALLYRLGKTTVSARTGLIAALLFAAWPDGIFYAARFYREPLAAFLLVLALNLIEAMLARPRRLAAAMFAGVGVGLLVLDKAESGLLFAALALMGLVYALRTRDFRTHALPWMVCGAAALLTTVPSVLATRAAYGEWMFTSAYTGATYVWAYCGPLPEAGAGDGERSFQARDTVRAGKAALWANQVLYFSKPSTSWRARDRLLMQGARACVRKDPGQAAYLDAHRALLTVFLLDGVAPAWIKAGDFGRGWPAALTRLLQAVDWADNAAVLLLLAPGLWVLLKDRRGRPAAAAVLWHVAFYSSVYYVSRYRVTTWPVFALAAAAGIDEAARALRRKRSAAALLIWVVVCVLGVGYVSRPWKSELWRWSGWTRLDIGESLTPAKRADFLAMMAQGVEHYGTMQELDRELGAFVRQRAGSLDPAVLIDAGDREGAKKLITSQVFFYRLSTELFPGQGDAAARLAALAALRRTVVLKEWKLAGKVPEQGLAVYTVNLPAPAVMSTYGPAQDTRLTGGGVLWRLNRELDQGAGLAPFQFDIKDAQVWITVPEAAVAPSPDAPLRLEYYSLP